MTFTCSALQWSLWDWTTAVSSGPTTFGYVWRLGHAGNPVLVSFTNSSKVQGYSSSSSPAKLLLGLESAYSNDSSNGGYGSFSGTLASINAGMSHYASNGSPAWDLAGFLLVLADTTPGQEFFCCTIARVGSTTNAQNHTLLLFRSAAVCGWSVLLKRSDSYGRLFHSQDIYTWSNNQLVAATLMPPQPSSNEQQLIRWCGLYVAASSSGLFSHGTMQQLHLVRQRWTIENSWHWVRYVLLGEDAHLYKQRNGVQVLSILRTTAMNLGRETGSAPSAPIRWR